MLLDEKTRLLVVAAHPDDEVLGCGGTLARAVASGARTAVYFMGEGISARYPFGEYNSKEFEEQTRVRTEGAQRALKSLGVHEVTFNNKRLCCQFDILPIITLAKEIEAVLERFGPTALLTHNPSEVNIDHKIVYEAVEIACRPTRPFIPKAIYTFEVVCSGSWPFESTFKPNVFVDVSPFWEQKMKAWHCYEGESRPFPFPRSDTGLETLARYRGMASGLPKAEAFRLVRQVLP